LLVFLPVVGVVTVPLKAFTWCGHFTGFSFKPQVFETFEGPCWYCHQQEIVGSDYHNLAKALKNKPDSSGKPGAPTRGRGFETDSRAKVKQKHGYCFSNKINILC